MFDRLELMIGKDVVSKLKTKKILLVGLGGVGGMCFEMLIRSGIKYITVCDYDSFEISNLNRQILSTNNNIGLKKTKAAYLRAKEINNEAVIKCYDEKVDDNFINNFEEPVDYIIDACDDIKAKIGLIKYAKEKNIKIISCMSAGNRLDPEKLTIKNIWDTKYDPLAKKLRHELRKEKIDTNLTVVTSTEQIMKLKNKVGSICTVTNYAGILLANYVIKDLLED